MSSSSTEYNINTYKDFEIMWIDRETGQLKDMLDVTLEIYHYQGDKPPQIIVPNKEPYIITENFTDTVNIGSVDPSIGIFIDTEVYLDLNIIANNLSSLGCPPNDYVVCNTNQKIAIVNGYKVASLSACELASLINLGGASGYTASCKDGFLVITGDYVGSTAYLQIGSGSFNSVVGVHLGDQYYGTSTMIVYDIPSQPMTRVSLGRYVYTNVYLSIPPYSLEERYFAVYRGIDPTSGIPEIYQENFVMVNEEKELDFSYSFTK